MTRFEWITVALGLLSVLIIPTLVLVIRLVVRLTMRDEQIGRLADDVRKLAAGEERVHAEMYRTMREDRAATDRRLRWLEEHLWRTGGGRRDRQQG